MRSLLLFLAACVPVFAEDSVKVWVALRDKGPARLEGRAFENAPVHPPYLDRLRGAGLSVSVALKWQNRVSGWADPADLPRIEALPFVTSVVELPRKASAAPLPSLIAARRAGLRKSAATPLGYYQGMFDTLQASRLRARLDTLGRKAGEGVRIALIDGPFSIGHKAFEHLWTENRIADQWNFVDGLPQAAYDTVHETLSSDFHGQIVLSALAAHGSGFEGLVPHARYFFYYADHRDEEGYIEEDNVAAAIERAVDSGAQVINISLAYRRGFNDGNPDIPYSQLDGRTRPASLAALGAARRNVLVVVGMGNDGGQADPSLSSPADADSILSVGMADYDGEVCDYSSHGPTADGRIKPEIAATGWLHDQACGFPGVTPWAYDSDEPRLVSFGTSIAAPVITGIAALLRQLHPDASAREIRSALIATGRRAGAPDNATGHGLARAWRAHEYLANGGVVALARKAPPIVPAARSARLRDAQGRAMHPGSASPSLPGLR